MLPMPDTQFGWWFLMLVISSVLGVLLTVAIGLLRAWMRRVDDSLRRIDSRLDALFDRFLTKHEWEAWRKGFEQRK